MPLRKMKRGRDPMRCYCDATIAWKWDLRQPFTWKTITRVFESADVVEKRLYSQPTQEKDCMTHEYNYRPQHTIFAMQCLYVLILFIRFFMHKF